MKTNISILLIGTICGFSISSGQSVRIPANDPALRSVLNTPAVPAPTSEELADPPPGEIRKLSLREVTQLRGALATNLATAPAGPEGLQSPWMPKFQALKAAMDQIAASRLQRDVIDLIPKMKEVFTASGTPEYSEFFLAQGGLIRSLGVCVVNAIAENISDQSAKVTASDLANFVTVFSSSGFIVAPDWEDQIMPIDAMGVMILDAAAVVTQLKALPWKQAERFLSSHSAIDAFADYESTGGGLNTLKTKYQAHKVAIVAKRSELAAWVAQQRGTDPAYFP